MEMPSNCELRTRSVRKRTNNGCQSPSTPAHGDASQKDHAFRVGTFRCEAEPIANPGKFESIGFRSGRNRRADQGAEWLRIRSMASDAIADLNLWKRCSTG